MALVILLGGVTGVYYYNSQRSASIQAQSNCRDPDSINTHVYSPDRLIVQKDCLIVSGTVDSVIQEADGDYHVRLALDAPYQNLTNSRNEEAQYGYLILEIICANPISQPDAVEACNDYTNHIPVPNEGQHVVVTGPYVLDSDHGWMEIHPVYSLTVP